MNIWIAISTGELIIIISLIVIFYVKLHKKSTQEDGELAPIITHQDWSGALHDRFCEQWLTFFSEISYPISTEEKAKLLALLWNIASMSVDSLMVNNDDINLLQRHRDSVEYLIGKTEHWKNLKIFHRDPTTVPYQVIAIYDILKELGYRGKIVAFGYQLNFE